MFSPTEIHLEVDVEQQLHTDLFIHSLFHWLGSWKASLQGNNVKEYFIAYKMQFGPKRILSFLPNMLKSKGDSVLCPSALCQKMGRKLRGEGEEEQRGCGVVFSVLWI